jgi:hypothetical protein
MKIILIATFTFFSFVSSSQGNLQFNQVLTYTSQIPKSGFGSTYTVPNGKVWKIESISADGPAKMSINGNGVPFYFNATTPSRGVFPFWLKSGDNIYLYDFGGGVGSYGVFISIIEFNIIP